MIRRARALAILLPLPLALTACDETAPAPVAQVPDTKVLDDPAWAADLVGQMNQLVGSRSAYLEINPLEADVAAVTEALLEPWEAAFEAGSLPEDLAARLNGAGLTWQADAATTRDRDGILEQRWALGAGAAPSAAEWLAGFTQVDDLMLDVVKAVPSADGVLLTVHLDLRGIATDGMRRNDRATLELLAVDGEDGWSLANGQVIDAVRLLATRAPAFADATAQWGMDQVPVNSRKEAIRRGGYALAVVDYDNDAKPDVLVGNYGPVQLFRNTGEGWEDVTQQAGLSVVGVVKSAAFADLDQDGDRDLALLRFVEDDGDPIGDFVAFENNGDGTFTEKRDVLPRSRIYDRAMPLAMGDYNGDGKLDIYVGFPGVRDFTSGIANREREASLASQGIWYNQGGWAFAEADDDHLVVQQNQVYAHAALSSDIDGDGTPEIIVVDDSGRVNPIYRLQGDTGGWQEIATDLGLTQPGMSMGITTGDFNGDGQLDIMATNVTLTAGQRLAASGAELDHELEGLQANFQRIADGYQSLILYQNMGDGHFEDVTHEAGLDWAGEAAASGEWIDYNHDGLLDYYLPNGLWTSGDEDLGSLYMRAELASYKEPLYQGLNSSEAPDSPLFLNDVHGSSNFTLTPLEANPILRLLRSHETAGDLTWSLGGNERNRLFRNNGDGTFTEVGYLEAADRVEDGYIVAPVDIDGDGRQDLVLRNTDPAPRHSYNPVTVLRNQLDGQAVTLSLQASQGTAMGARVTAWVNGKPLVREVRSVNGAVQAEPVAYVGLAGAAGVDRVEIRWPDGSVQQIGALQAGSHTIAQK